MTPTVIATEAPPCVRAQGTFGGGYTRPCGRQNLVEQSAAALNYEQYGTRDVNFIGPEWVRDELRRQGFDKI